MGLATGDMYALEPRISPKEFDCPFSMSPSLLALIQEIRQETGLPMYFTKLGDQLRHPHGDGVPFDSVHHSPYSFHRVGMDHEASQKYNRPIRNNAIGFLAVDFDFGRQSPPRFVELAWYLHGKPQITGLGVYPHWNNRGFHIDVGMGPRRPYGWLQDMAGDYLRLTPQLLLHHCQVSGYIPSRS